MQAAQAAAAKLTRDPRRWVILGVICLAQFVVLLDNTVLNVAIPSINEELGATIADTQWMINAYALLQSGLLLTAGSLSDRYGRKRALVVGLLLFGLGSLVAAYSQSAPQLIAARAGMGIGGALLMTTTLAVIMQIFDDEERPRAIGIWAAVSSIGFAAGPVIGGVFLAHFWWGSIFLINVPIALLSVVTVVLLVPESKSPMGKRPDLVGAVLSTIGMVGIVYAIISIPEHGWTSNRVLVPGLVGAVALTAFVRWEARNPFPMLDMGLFRNQRFTGAITGGLLVAFGMAGSLFLLTQHLQFVLGYSPLAAGLRTAPLALTIVALNLWGAGAKLLPKVGTSGTIALGMILLAAGLCGVALLGRPEYGYGGMLAGLLVMGCGIALAIPAMANAIMSAIPPEKAGAGAGVQSTVTEFGGGLGVAVLGAALNARFVALLPAVVGVGAVGSLQEALSETLSPQARTQVLDAFADSVRLSQLIGAAAVLVGGLLAALLLQRAERAEATPAGTPSTTVESPTSA
ncbi:MFS transporter [Micromonospora sp. NBS 11-29]|uniref:MFS transporter n=1 Tax=Micromonospora sp. NBS 11-29 TaxID=1960879 RepID=UPI000B77DC2C|nr:MFS transporter [Micromonospora sp. NBS 11-29]